MNNYVDEIHKNNEEEICQLIHQIMDWLQVLELNLTNETKRKNERIEWKKHTWLERNCIDVIPRFDEVDDEDDWRRRFSEDEGSVGVVGDGSALGVVLLDWRGRSVRGPGWVIIGGDWMGEGFRRSCSFDTRGRLITPKQSA